MRRENETEMKRIDALKCMDRRNNGIKNNRRRKREIESSGENQPWEMI